LAKEIWLQGRGRRAQGLQVDDDARRQPSLADHVPVENGPTLCVKFQADVVTEFTVMSFKEN
jgi:hypothetical protein